MADYKELLRRAVEALPENNGAARRAVYEKARAALVGQLRAINPPLAARDITAHRLQLEDCIRQVEQEASEAVIAGLGAGREEAPPPPPVYFEPPAKKAIPAAAKPVAKPLPTSGREPPRPLPQGGSIEEIIAAANAEQPEPVEAKRTLVRPDGKPMGKPVPKLVPQPRPQISGPAIEDEPAAEPQPNPVFPGARPIGPAGRPLPSIVARAEAVKSRAGATPFGGPVRGPVLEPRREISGPRLEPAARGGHQMAAQQPAEPVALFNAPPVPAAMSAVREVEVEPTPVDPQRAIDRAIATLDREARGDLEEDHYNGVPHSLAELDPPEEEAPRQRNGFASPFPSADIEDAPKRDKGRKREKAPAPVRPAKGGRERGRGELPASAFPRARAERERGFGAVTIFLIVFAVLLLGAGGAGFWAWREGFINLDQMFAHGTPAQEQAASDQPAPAATTAEVPATGPGNTDTPAATPATAPELKPDERLPSDTPVATEAQPLSILPTPAPSEERLDADGATNAGQAAAAVASTDAARVGSQSLLLEASDSGTTGAVPFSGTVEWSKGTDERGMPTLVAKANIPARNLGVDVLIRKNSDPSLPASHLMEVNFRVNDSFIGGSIAGLPGVLLKNEELVQGTPLVGASARVVGNSFLFALSASPEDLSTNTGLLTSRKWIDLALIYATGKRAIITLEKDEAASKLFSEVVAEWGKAAAASR